MIANLLFKTAVEQDNNININMKEYFHIYVLQSRHIMRDVPPHICIIIIIDEGGHFTCLFSQFRILLYLILYD